VSGGHNAEERATDMKRRVTHALSTRESRQGAVVPVQPSGADAFVNVGHALVFTVTPADAAGSGTPLAVATGWAALLAQGLRQALPGARSYF
jgi:hypothetical protein